MVAGSLPASVASWWPKLQLLGRSICFSIAKADVLESHCIVLCKIERSERSSLARGFALASLPAGVHSQCLSSSLCISFC
jgi:hypothetical protein